MATKKNPARDAALKEYVKRRGKVTMKTLSEKLTTGKVHSRKSLERPRETRTRSVRALQRKTRTRRSMGHTAR